MFMYVLYMSIYISILKLIKGQLSQIEGASWG